MFDWVENTALKFFLPFRCSFLKNILAEVSYLCIPSNMCIAITFNAKKNLVRCNQNLHSLTIYKFFWIIISVIKLDC